MPSRKEIEEERAYLFEKTHDLEQIREVALRMKCGKIDMEFVRSVKTKEQLVKYLKSRDCPALRHLEAKLFSSM
jgi:hypothetical protein